MATGREIAASLAAGIEAVVLASWPTGRPTTAFVRAVSDEQAGEIENCRGYRLFQNTLPTDTEFSSVGAPEYVQRYSVDFAYPLFGSFNESAAVAADDVQRLSVDLRNIGGGGAGSVAMQAALGAKSGHLYRVDVTPRGILLEGGEPEPGSAVATVEIEIRYRGE